jgi:nitroimidazol reductase NimA-like FMN-containing flavoprotein (pyridoxamine 5'-phosphate oxidase superfamily)
MVSKLSPTGQAPPLTRQEIESMLKENHYARICTHNKDGTIHAVPVAYGYINNQILMMSFVNSRKNKNIERNNDVTVLIDTLSPVTRGILIYGTAELDYDNLYQKVLAINELSPAFREMPKEKLERITRAYVDMFKLVIVKITPKHITTFDYAKDEAWNNFVKIYLQE